MGTQSSKFDNEPTEVLTSRIERSQAMLEHRMRRHQLYNSIVKRVLNSEQTTQMTSRLDLLYLPEPALINLLKFLVPDLHVLLVVSAYWRLRILEAMDNMFANTESNFSLVHSNLLVFKNSYLSTGRISLSSTRGLRAERVMVAEPLSILAGYTVKLRCVYKLHSRPEYFKAEYKFDCIKEGTKAVWVHRDECKFNGEEHRRANTAAIPTMSVGDHLEVALNWLSLQGLVDLDSIQWQPPLIQETKAVLKSLTLAHEKMMSDKTKHTTEAQTVEAQLYAYRSARMCEVELTQLDWFDVNYYLKPKEVYRFDHFAPFLRLIKCEFAGVDVTISKNTYLATAPGIVPDSSSRIGVTIEVVDSRARVTTEIKRMGLLFDRHCPVQLRVGDTLVLYISRGG
mmetsp:Transcript_3640/g.7815  ORF Transcript_3640/g.7815 Transcript_3640/m.7815 type:complete len:397 (+) Transcript_3640:2577-3767(+)